MKPRLIDNLLRKDLALSPYELEVKYKHLFPDVKTHSLGLTLNIILDEFYKCPTFSYHGYINLMYRTIRDIENAEEFTHKATALIFLKHYKNIFFELLKEAQKHQKHKGFQNAN